jgi:hypothetical protein
MFRFDSRGLRAKGLSGEKTQARHDIRHLIDRLHQEVEGRLANFGQARHFFIV